MREVMRWRRQPELRLVQDYHRDAGWVAAVADSIRAHWAAKGRGDRLLRCSRNTSMRRRDGAKSSGSAGLHNKRL
jgi:hypothetical protein